MIPENNEKFNYSVVLAILSVLRLVVAVIISRGPHHQIVRCRDKLQMKIQSVLCTQEITGIFIFPISGWVF